MPFIEPICFLRKQHLGVQTTDTDEAHWSLKQYISTYFLLSKFVFTPLPQIFKILASIDSPWAVELIGIRNFEG